MRETERGIVALRAVFECKYALLAAGIGLAALAGGCSSSIQTPLPEIRPSATTGLSEQDRKKAVDELNHKRATHEQDAEQEIEQSR